MKKILTLLLFVALSFSMIACGGDNNEDPATKPGNSEDEKTPEKTPVVPNAVKLSAPTITVDEEGLATWTVVENASSYVYVLNGGMETVATGNTLLLTDGDKLKVKAAGDGINYTDSDYSAEATYTVEIVDNPTGKTENTVVKTRPDDRQDAYAIYEADGTFVENHKSLYAAIISCVANTDADAYVTAIGSTNKLFVNATQYQEDTKDMFWYYTEGTVRAKYTAWQNTYWQDCKDTDQICIFKNNGTQELEPYANGYKLVSTANTDDAKAMPVWNSCWYLEASATVNLEAYSGITKGVYNIALSQSKVYPSYEGSHQTYAYIGFITADAYNVSNQGLRCDTTTGNWYYYSGETAYNACDIEIDDSACIVTSTWDDTEKCFKPDYDVVLTMELLQITDEDGETFIVHRLTVQLSNGDKYHWDYELPKLTLCGTIRFTCGLDINPGDDTFPDYMNGAKFENVVVTSAKGTVYQKMLDNPTLYGNTPTLKYDGAGDYDLLNSNAASAARFQTIIYTPACVSYDFSTPGKDVYSFSYDF